MNRYVLIGALLVAGCGDVNEADTPEVAAKKQECRALLEHIVSISPQAAGRDAKQVAAELPVEEVESCTAVEGEVRACMAEAKDVAGVKACIPSGGVISCMASASAAKLPDVRATCWAKRDDKKAIEALNAQLACVAKANEKKRADIAGKCMADAKAADAL